MYVPKPFAETDVARLHALVRAHPFATLVSSAAGELFASHVPLLLDATDGGLGTLHGHVARANPHAAALADGVPSLAIFHGAHAYVSPRWYAGAPNVPTWNYVAVHASGTARALTDPVAVRGLLARTAAAFEAGAGAPWTLEQVPAPWADGLQRAIVAFALPIERLEGKRKLSQNKSAADRAGVVAALRASGLPGDAEVAAAMEALP